LGKRQRKTKGKALIEAYGEPFVLPRQPSRPSSIHFVSFSTRKEKGIGGETKENRGRRALML